MQVTHQQLPQPPACTKANLSKNAGTIKLKKLSRQLFVSTTRKSNIFMNFLSSLRGFPSGRNL